MYTLGLGSFLGDFADRYTPGEVQYGTSEEVNQRQKTENLIDERNFEPFIIFSIIHNYIF